MAADWVKTMGGTVTSEPTWLSRLLHDESLGNVTIVWLTKRPVTDADMVRLQGFKHLKKLVLYETNITDAGLVFLEGLDELQMLGLARTTITDVGLMHLRGLRNLEVLNSAAPE